ncbi:MAG: stage III sporulation protein AB [Fusicatenibacter sp.]|nr:stage III sporulation protein AB [Fusicatenibacter sp.]
MIRGMALLLAAASCVGLGCLKSAAYSERLRDLHLLCRIVKFLKGEISYAATPLPDAFWTIGGRMEDPYQDFLRDISEDLKRCSGRNFSAVFSENVDCHLQQTRLTREDLEELKAFGAGLGYLDRTMQLSWLEQYEEQLKQKIEELNLGLPVRKKLCRSLGIMGGLFLIILFL